MKNRKDPANRQTGEDMYGIRKNSGTQLRDFKQSPPDKQQPKKMKMASQYTDNQNAKQKRFHTHQNPYLDQPHSNKNDEVKKISNQRYFKKEKSEQKKIHIEPKSEPNHSKTDLEQGKKKWKNQIASSEYNRLNDKLNNIEQKISEMKLNLQRKKQEKILRQKEAEEKKKIQQIRLIEQTKTKGETKTKKPTSLKGLVTQVPEHGSLHTFEKNPYSPRHNIYYVSEIVRAYKDRQSLARQHLQTSLQILAYFQHVEQPSDEDFATKKLNLPKPKGYEDKKTVIFDLDETLIHCNQNLNAPFDVKLPIVFPTGQVIEAGINIRPYAKQIIQKLSSHFEVIVFTASHSCYANVVLDYLDPEKRYIHHRLFREHCYATPEGMHIKDLRVLNREMSDMVLVDNAAYSYLHQLDNGIPIIPYYKGADDYELKALESYVDSMLLVKDMRLVNRRTFKLQEYRNYFHNLEKLVEDLYLVDH